MLRFKTQQSSFFYVIIGSAVSLVMALLLWVLPDAQHVLLLLILLALPVIGYVLDYSLNRAVQRLKGAEAKIQGSFKKFEDREKQYQVNVEELSKELTRLQQLNVNLQETKNFNHILSHIADAAQNILEFERILIFIYDKTANMLQCREARGYTGLSAETLQIPVAAEGGILARAFEEQRLFHIKDFTTVPADYHLALAFSEEQLLPAKSFVVLPLVVNDQGLGVLLIDHGNTSRPISDQRVELFKLFAYQASLALANIQMQEELQQLNTELSQNYQELLKRRDFYSQIAQDLSSAMTQMSISINEVTRSAHSLTRQSENLITRGNELRNHLSNIDDIIASINNVTRQTKLLAFSATIEAVRVGEAGKGFAVVAEEVRKLAQQSADDSTTIKSSLKAMQETIKAIIEVADATHDIALLEQSGTEQMSIVTKDVMKRAEDLVDSLQF